MPGTSIGGNSRRRARIHSAHEGTLEVEVEVPTGVEEEETPKEENEGLSNLSVDELEALLEEAEVELSTIEGTGSGGGVVKADLIRTLEELEEEDEELEDDEDDS